MKKSVLLSGMACSIMLVGAGCAMCSDPIPKDPSCIEDSHTTNVSVSPKAFAETTPVILPTKTVFRPVFRSGAKIFGSGKGLSEKEAVDDAIANIIAECKCDYLVAVTHIATYKTHPTWRLFSTTNYSVKIAGIPIFLDHLEEEKTPGEQSGAAANGTPAAAAAANNNAAAAPPAVCSCDKNNTNVPLSLLRLSDIKVSITANGDTDDKAGVIFPVK